MIARNAGRPVELSRVRSLCDVDRQGTSLLQLSRVAEQLGFRTLRVRTTYEALVTAAPLPCVAHWNQNHFVVVYGRTRGGLRVADPARGLVTYSAREFQERWLSGLDKGVPSGVALLLEPLAGTVDTWDSSGSAAADGPRGFRLLIPYIRPHLRALIQAVAGVFAVALLRLALPFLTRAIVDAGITQQNLGVIQLILIAQIVLLISRTGAEFLQARLLLHIGARIDLSLVSDFLRKLLRLPIAFFESRMPGDLLQRIEDHARIEQLLSTTALLIITSLLNVLMFGIALACFSTHAFVILLVGTGAQLAFIAAFVRPRASLEARQFGQMARTRGLMIECVNGIADIKIGRAEVIQRWAWEREQAKLYRTRVASLGIEQMQQAGSYLVAEIASAVITVVAAKQVITGALTLGDLLAIQYLVGQVALPISQVVGVVQSVQEARLSLDRMSEVFATPDECPDGRTPATGAADGNLELQNVRFGYRADESAEVLRGVSIAIPAGKVTAIVGTSGSGKTTLLKLLLRLNDPNRGVIRLGGRDLQTIGHDEWRARCGAVMQDGVLFTDTIARNIALGADEIDAGRVARVSQLACVTELIDSLPLGFDTKVGPGGVGLSHGQRQRILIARALYGDPEFLFLDEATSSLDAETERQIVENLESVFCNRTVVVVAHRLSTVRHADQIVVLERGQVVEIGHHAELVSRQGRYLELIQNQLELQRSGA